MVAGGDEQLETGKQDTDEQTNVCSIRLDGAQNGVQARGDRSAPPHVRPLPPDSSVSDDPGTRAVALIVSPAS